MNRKIISIIISLSIVFSAFLILTVDTVKSNSVETDNKICLLIPTDYHCPYFNGWDTMADLWGTDSTFADADFVIDTGDSVHVSASSQWDEYVKEFVDSRDRPFFQVSGNHDMMCFSGESSGYEWRGNIYNLNASGKTDFTRAFLYQNCLFILLDDEADENINTPWQKEFLVMLTDMYPDKTTLIFTHNDPGYTKGSNQWDEATATDRPYSFFEDKPWWVSFLANNSQIKFYAHGHDHNYYVVKKNGVFYNEGQGQTNDGWFSWVVITNTTISSTCYNKYGTVEHATHTESGYSNNISSAGFEKMIYAQKIQNGQSYTWYNHNIADNYTLLLMGTDKNDMAFNSNFSYFINCTDYPGNCYSDNRWVGFETATCDQDDSDNDMMDDGKNNLCVGDGGICIFHGADQMRMSQEYYNDPTYSNTDYWVMGKYYYTMPWLVPSTTYKIAVRAKANVNTNNALDVHVNVLDKPDIDTVDAVYTPVYQADLTTSWQWFNGTFTTSSNPNIWLGQVNFQTYGSNTYYLDEYRFEVNSPYSHTENFSLTINNETHVASGVLNHHSYQSFNLDDSTMNNTLNINASIGGNNMGIFVLMYNDVKLKSEDATLGDWSGDNVRVGDEDPYCTAVTLDIFDDETISGVTNHTLSNGFSYSTLTTAEAPKTITLSGTSEGYGGSERLNISFQSINGQDNNTAVQDQCRWFNWTRDANATKYSIRISNYSDFHAEIFLQLDNITVSNGNCTNTFLNTSISDSTRAYNYWENSTSCFFYLPYRYNITYYGYHYYQVRAYTT